MQTPAVLQKEALRAQFLPDFPNAAEKRTLLFLGRFHPKKGLDRILKCLQSLKQSIPNVLLVIAGDGEAHYTRHLRQLVSALALDDHVLFAGRLDGELKWASFAAAELFLLPSRQENFAITVAEAMQMGVPVIITEKVNTWPYVKEAGAGLVLDERDINSLLPHAIEELLKDEATRSENGSAGEPLCARAIDLACVRAKTPRLLQSSSVECKHGQQLQWKLSDIRICRVLEGQRAAARLGACSCGGCFKHCLCCRRHSTCLVGDAWR